MFYPVDSLRRGGRFYLCWVADSWPLRFATITHRQLWSQDIIEICNDLLEVIKNESGRPTNRFSLRLSSQLLRGLVRLYQRKVTVFVGDLCMINAHVMKSTHKHCRSSYEESEQILKSLELPQIILEVQPDEEAVEEKIQNSGNIVAHIEDITLREPTLSENRILLDDGFGEQQLVLGDRSLETMLLGAPGAGGAAAEPSGSRDSSALDHTRLQLREARMERLSEHNISVFGKSMGEGMLLGDFEKDLPEIPDLPHPAPPHADKESEQDTHREKEFETKQPASDEIVLEELEEEPQVKRRKLKSKLIIDKRMKLSSDYIRSRLDNKLVETRSDVLFQPPRPRPAPPPRPLGAALSALRLRALRRLAARDTPQFQEVVLQSNRHSIIDIGMRTILEKIDEDVEAVAEKYEGNLELQDVSKQMVITYKNLRDSSEPLMHELTDMADLPTQKLPESSQAKKRVGEEQQSPKRRRSGYISFRHNQQQSLELSPVTISEANKENVPSLPPPAARLTALLQRDGLADEQQHGGSDTPRGSLDRTRVSLGDSDHTTDSRKLIREEWGTQGAMHKIYRCIKAGASPLDLRTLLSSGPLLAGHGRLIAARCFTSILKLKQHGFICISKDSKTCEIKDISLGSKIIQDK